MNIVAATMSNPIHPTSQTPQQLTLTKLKQLMPEAFSEGQLDIRKLTALLSEQDIAPVQEAYGLSWAGKHQVYRELKTPTSQTLVPQPDESVDFDTSQNLFIEGDNLAVLKILQKSYHSRVKMIYIDPPYNTGNDRFVYADDFSESIADYKARAGQTDEDGNLTHSDGMRGNRKENGQYHSNWLNMMYPRLALAKSLLREDGVIFVSIDDEEVANLRLLMDEIFGEENFINQISVHSKLTAGASGGGEDKKLKKNIEYLLCYTRNNQFFDKFSEVYEKESLMTHILDYKSKGKSWKYTRILVSEGDKEYFDTIKDGSDQDIKIYKHTNVVMKTITDVSKEEKLSEDEVYKKYFEKIFRDTNAQSSIRQRVIDATGNDESFYSIEYYPISGRSKGKLTTLFYKGRNKDLLAWLSDIAERDEDGELIKKQKLGTLWSGIGWNNITKEGGVKFSNGKKPVEFIQKMIQLLSDNEDSLILDFFAGSSTTAHAVMDLNVQDGGVRKFIMVQIDESIDKQKNKDEFQFCVNNGMPPNIAEISKERIRRAAAHISSELPESVDSEALDFGFKAYKLADSNFIPWQQPASYDADSLMAQLEKHLDPIVDTATTDGIITELMLKEGYTLTATVSKADGYYLVTQNDALIDNFDADSSDNAGTSMRLAIVLDDMTTDKATQIIASAPNKTLIMDRAFSDDANKANIVLQFEDAGLVVGCV